MEAGPIVEKGKAPQRVVIKARWAQGACVKCGRPIQPGQLYVREPVRHLGCRP